MVATVGLFVLFVLGTSWACDARELTTTELSSRETVISDVSVLQINHQESEGIIKASEEVGRNENVCTLCEEFAAKAIEYLEDKKTQTEIIDILHNTCARLIPIEQKVRDRATLYLNMLEVDGAIVETDKDVKNFLFGSLDVPLVNLEMSLKNYVQEPSEEPFDNDSVPKEPFVLC